MGDSDTYFVYLDLFGKPSPQKWYGDKKRMGLDEFRHKPVQDGGDIMHLQRLQGEDISLSIEELAAKYPCKIGTNIQ